MNLLTLIPHYKRPDVLKETIEQLPLWVSPVYILSPEDKDLRENIEIIEDAGHAWFEADNDPVNMKLNEGVSKVLSIFKFDYLMSLNSDSLINPDYLTYLHIALNGNDFDCVGANDLFYVDFHNRDKCGHYKYPIQYPMGSGRIIRREVLENIFPPYPGNQNSGLDGVFASNFWDKGYEFTMVETAGIPMVCDLKSATNITPANELHKKSEAVDWNMIKPYFYG